VKSAAHGYFYGGFYQFATTNGMFANVTVGRPELSKDDSHTLAELAAESADSKNIVEVGWTVDRSRPPNDDFPRLFVFRWVDGKPGCYNGCGWVQESASIRPGMVLTTGSKPKFDIEHTGSRWVIRYDGETVGHFPDSLWGGKFTQAGLVQWFGEVSVTNGNTKPCTDMGNGLAPNSRQAAAATGMGLHGGPALSLTKSVTDGTLYNARTITSNSMRFGGPGSGPC